MAYRTSPATQYALERKYAYAKYELISTEVIPTTEGTRIKRIYLGSYFNCFGDQIWGSPFQARDGVTYPEGVMVDLRSVELMMMGCCPDELSIDMIEGYE